MDIDETRPGLVGDGDVFGIRLPGVVAARKRVRRDAAAQVAGLYQVVQRLGGFLLVDCVLVDELAERVEVIAEDRLARPHDGNVVGGRSHGGQYQNQRDDDHELEQGESRGERPWSLVLGPWFLAEATMEKGRGTRDKRRGTEQVPL